MLIEFRSSDRMFGLKAIGIYRKGIEAAKAACDKVYVETVALLTADSDAERAEEWIAEQLDEMGVGEVRDLAMPTHLALSLRLACSVYLTQLGKLSEKEADMLVPLDHTNELMSHLTSLVDRLRGQTEIEGTITMATPGREPVTLTHTEFSRAVDKMTSGKV